MKKAVKWRSSNFIKCYTQVFQKFPQYPHHVSQERHRIFVDQRDKRFETIINSITFEVILRLFAIEFLDQRDEITALHSNFILLISKLILYEF